MNKNNETRFEEKKSEQPESSLRRKTILSFTLFGIFIVLVMGVLNWLQNQPKDSGTPKPFRKALSFNERLFGGLFDTAHLVPTYPVSKAEKKVRVNGDAGMSGTLTEENWQLKIIKLNGDTLRVSLNDLKKLPKTDVIFDFKCIEGWSQVTHWGGVKMLDFITRYHLESEFAKQYVGMQTPDEEYYVGIDRKSAIHPQTILCYEMNGKELPQNQGFPLRLIIPVKYGVKHLKRIGTMFFSDSKPRDYWAERGYDYYAGH